jgi:hypothetical protein
MIVDTISVYIGRWNDRELVYALKREQAQSLVEKHFAFGDPSKDQYALGNVWASAHRNEGWRIDEHKVAAAVIDVEIKSSQGVETPHLIWQCPYCKQFYSDEWRNEDELPILLRCGCEDASRYLLGGTNLARSVKGDVKETYVKGDGT